NGLQRVCEHCRCYCIWQIIHAERCTGDCLFRTRWHCGAVADQQRWTGWDYCNVEGLIGDRRNAVGYREVETVCITNGGVTVGDAARHDISLGELVTHHH